ncbi:ankyrin repeat domain-containing protein [Luteolibacter marinus]|uniref:ankyrin repeat domain-containing protein n=1 Tax=Luteolibacter marinus TaxID=2776705 RepID=UPI00186789B8|nr:ankyrin repeat domain-containing protein [Luteolibacter marinus]
MKPLTQRLLAIALMSSAAVAAPADLREPLRDALYTEEVTRDPEAAAKQYEAILAAHDAQRPFAATALFRLAEVRRKQNRNDEAIALYQRLLLEFPRAEAEAKLARENLAALGGELPAGDTSPEPSDEELELAHVKELAETSPDALAEPSIICRAIRANHLEVIKFILGKTPEHDFSKPEGSMGTPLSQASGAAALEACRLLLDAGVDPNATGNREALEIACHEGFFEIARLLLNRGADPNGKGSQQPLKNAVMRGHARIASLLLDKGANPDLPVPAPGRDEPVRITGHPVYGASNTMLRREFGEPLLLAAMQEDTVMLELLLKRGADPNHAEIRTGLTALHLCVSPAWGGNRAAVPLLLAAGAKPDVEAKAFAEETHTGLRAVEHTGGMTPLLIAVRNKLLPEAILLLEAGAPAGDSELLLESHGDPRLMELLLKHGADPDGTDASGMPLLFVSIQQNRSELFRALINSGADVNRTYQGNSPLREAAKKEETWSLAETLISRGAVPEGPWKDNLFEGSDPSNRSKLIRRFNFPEVAARPAISVFLEPVQMRPRWEIMELVASKSDEAPPPLLDLILSRRTSDLGRSGFYPDGHTNQPWPDFVTLTRFQQDGKAEEIKIELTGGQPFPSLAWGDILEFQRSDHPAADPHWALLKRVAFPVTVEIQGRDRHLEVRGDCLVFDPTSDVIPWLGAGALMRLLWQPLDPSIRRENIEIVVVRTGWQDIRLPLAGGGPSDFQLEEGDTLKLILPPPPAKVPPREDGQWWETPEARLSRVTLHVPGHPFVRHFGVTRKTDIRPAAPTVPTLLQALADVLAPTYGNGPNVEPDKLVGAMIQATYFNPVVVLPHPDFSKIRLRRLLDDGNEEVRVIDLATVIRASSETTTTGDARSADLVLQGGDIIELPLLKDHSGETWKGVSPKVADFFRKALSCRVQYTDTRGTTSLRDIIYQPVHFEETEAGWYPFPPDPKRATATLRASAALETSPYSDFSVTRDGVDYEKLTTSARPIFLRDGDILLAKSIPVPPPQKPAASR